MNIDKFSEIIDILTLAKKLHDINRYDIVKNQFFDVICYDSWFENILGVISSVFSSFYNNYDDGSETEIMIFTDDVISNYYHFAREFGKNTNTPHDKNPYVLEAESEVSKLLSFCYSVGWKLLGYTKTKKTTGQSKLIVYTGTCDCNCHANLAYSLIQLHQWFSDKCTEFRNKAKSIVEEVVVA